MYEVDLSGFCRLDCRGDWLAVGLRATEGARTSLVNLERLSDEELDRLRHEFERISQSRADRR